ncbi:MAG: transcriptional regulator [Gemmataceae bacterium]
MAASQDCQSVPLFDLRTQFRGLEKSLEEAIVRVLQSGHYILGEDVMRLEEEVARYCGAAYAVGCASGSDALLLAFKALEIGAGDEVLVPAFTFFASAAAVVRAGATPVFVDIDPATYTLDPHQVENKINQRTRAIVAVHLFGQCADMEPLWRIAERHNLVIVEDAAQALGAEYQGKRAGTLGALACLSFYPTKNLGACGDAGMVVTNDPEWAERVAALRVHGTVSRYEHRYLGWNSRLDTLQAAILRVKLPWLDRWIDARQAIARRYDALIEESYLAHFLVRPTVRPHSRHTFNQYVVRVADGRRDALKEHLRTHGIGCEVYYPKPLHLQEAFAFLGYGPGDFPASEKVCQEVLALPMFPELSYQAQKRVIQTCAGYLRQRARLAA